MNASPLPTAPKIRYWIPEAMVTEEGLRADVQAFARRGFSGIEVVPANFVQLPVDKGYEWGSPRWYDAITTILDEARKHSMTVDLALSLQWPISSPAIASADDPAALYELTWGATEVSCPAAGPITLPKPRITHEEGTPHLLHVAAYRMEGEGLLDLQSHVDLTGSVQDGRVAWDTTGLAGTWALFGFWDQPAVQKIAGRYYVIDHLGRKGAESCACILDDLLTHVPTELTGSLGDLFCDSMEYDVALEWTRGLEKLFSQQHGYDPLPYLPALDAWNTYPKNDAPRYAFTSEDATRAFRRDWAQTVSWLYGQHLDAIRQVANSHGLKLRYQVAYNKPFSEEDAALVPDIPENESLGRPTLDNLRVMASAAHLGRKERYSFEAAAEFENVYGQSHEDICWWFKRSWACGCNAQVMHGGTYCGYYDGPSSADGMVAGSPFGPVAWPGFEAFGKIVSECWNRTTSEAAFAAFTDAAARINDLARARHKVDLAIVRDAFLNNGRAADGEHLVRDKGALTKAGYTYEFLSAGLLDHQNAVVEDGILDPEGAAWKALVLPVQNPITAHEAIRLVELASAGLPLAIMGEGKLLPASMADLQERAAWDAAASELEAASTRVASWDALVALLAERGIQPSCKPAEPAPIASVRLEPQDGTTYLLYHTNDVCLDAEGKIDTSTTYPGLSLAEQWEPRTVTFTLEGAGEPCLLNVATGELQALPFSLDDKGHAQVTLAFGADELRVVAFRPHKVASALPQAKTLTTGEGSQVPLGSWSCTVSELGPAADAPRDFYRSIWGQVATFEALPAPLPFDELDASFATRPIRGDYQTTFELADDPSELVLVLPQTRDEVEVWVNDKPVPVVPGISHRVPLAGLCHAGANSLRIRVSANLYNALTGKARYRYGLLGEPQLMYS